MYLEEYWMPSHVENVHFQIRILVSHSTER